MIDLTFFLTRSEVKSFSYTRANDFKGKDDNNQERIFVFSLSRSLCCRKIHYEKSLEENYG